ncbi:Acylphosphatase [Methylobacterium crusticola]|uniref:acylphosphatase n=1 Tax=Methylobacterium crusticola TaxID=1697972 RepID=A0ABQ4QWS8_9HYPH|nr:acylphosphatase [Methylobacterium crusticola]GJD49845.1 Acylphosphatase [Methylobacterium crusticola]
MSQYRSVEIVVRGRVQGVGYRAWAKTRAEALGLSGHVRNRREGTVEARLTGPAEAVTAMVAACREGPAGARVADVGVADIPAAAGERGVRILPTA